MRLLLLTHSFNSLTQRLYAELRALGHEVSVELDIAPAVSLEAVQRYAPDVLLAPFLKRRIAAELWQRLPCWVLHPGPPGDGGPSALDWAVLQRCRDWGVTLLQANDVLDAGPIWASAACSLRAASKGSLYRREVTEAAWQALQAALALWHSGARQPPPQAPQQRHWQPLLRQPQRALDWSRADSETALAHLRSADGQPGLLDTLAERPCYLYDAHPASAACMAAFAHAAPGAWLAQRDGALLRRSVDGGVWIGQARWADAPGAEAGADSFKLPAARVLGAAAAQLPQLPVPLQRAEDEWGELRYREYGAERARVGCLSFDFYNGAMSEARCQRLRQALLDVYARAPRVLLLLGGADFFSNGIDLNSIEAASYDAADSAADASWRAIEAMNDVALTLLQWQRGLTVSVLRGNAGAGGCFLALAADQVWARRSVVLNPHYKNMGNLYGSEYWTYLLPRRLGAAGAQALMQQRLPLLAAQAQALGLIDHCDAGPAEDFEARCLERAQQLATHDDYAQWLAAKQARRAADEAQQPLAEYRRREMEQMRRNFYGFDPSYHVARHHFVHKLLPAWTPRHLALHR